jgi:hypothetical protein
MDLGVSHSTLAEFGALMRKVAIAIARRSTKLIAVRQKPRQIASQRETPPRESHVV